jgi:hypothetical protein
MGSARASRVVFGALAENVSRTKLAKARRLRRHARARALPREDAAPQGRGYSEKILTIGWNFSLTGAKTPLCCCPAEMRIQRLR